MENKKPSSLTQSGRRKSGGSIQLRSPVVKRPTAAPVSLQGWLHKQGSEGLMLWKKRWFVLSEYCLFYYKGPEEEKLLGSILLPSYKVSPCTAEDKVYRKFAFKAEHANMRTYYFAAETRELMTQWMNALSLATILQENAKFQSHAQPSMNSMASIAKQSSEDSSGFQGYKSSSGPITVQPTSQEKNLDESNCGLNGWLSQSPHNPYQPLYANAPPKPKRLNNEGQYGGSSPETSPNRRDDIENVYGNRRQIQESAKPVRHHDYHYKQEYSPGFLPNPDLLCSMPLSGTYSGEPLKEKRTPNTLELNGIGPQNYYSRGHRIEEERRNYSDVSSGVDYNRRILQRMEGQNFLGYGKFVNYSAPNYQHPNQYYESYQQTPQTSSIVNKDLESVSRRERQPPRPYSADFLDYDAKKHFSGKELKQGILAEKSRLTSNQYNSSVPPRPKSSLDIIHTNDGYYWSEERYAEKMRQSAMYLQNTLPQKSQSSRANTPILKQTLEGNKVTLNSREANEQTPVVLRQKWSADSLRETAASPTRPASHRWSEHQNRLENNFMRSASARLPPKQRGQDEESDEVQAYTGGEDFNEGRKEESMKRLLEWKQRMLQSPLTRKSSGSSTRGTAHNELSKYYKQQVLKELERQEAENREELGKKRAKGEGHRGQNILIADRRRSATLVTDRYYSYSSDDEENEEINQKRVRRPIQRTKPWTEEIKDSSKENKDQDKSSNYVSPDYENVPREPEFNEKLSGFSSKPTLSSGENVKQKTSDKDEIVSLKQPQILKSENVSPEHGATQFYKNNSVRFSDETKSSKRSGIIGDFMSSAPTVYPIHESHQPATGNKKSNWNSKIDETKLIKEFSYQYIVDPKTSEKSTPTICEDLEGASENLVKSRIKQLGLKEHEDDKNGLMKEPLKMSTPVYCLNEALVSSLKNADDKSQERRKDITKFALGSSPTAQELTAKVPEKHQKSVKDLLADFERKSQIAQEKESLEHEKGFEDVPGKRYFFSDTETLLYDTSSDTEDKKEESPLPILNTLRRPEIKSGGTNDLTEEEDRDEEVAATLSCQKKFTSPYMDQEKNQQADYIPLSKCLSKSLEVPVEPSSSSETETIVTPGYAKSLLTESVAELENSDSTCSTPTIERIKDDLEKTLPRENLTKELDISKEVENGEGHYMPMTPSRRVSAPSSDKSRSNSSLHSFLFGGDAEETYVEMTENGISNSYLEQNKPSLFKIKKSYLENDTPGYCEIDNTSHYEYLYRGNLIREPEYMEVNTLLEILKEQDEKIKEHKDAVEEKLVKKSKDKISKEVGPPTPPRSALPDILNSSSTSHQNTKSDSSDADDESSKDLDSLDVPRHPRFSLSDTFRPASYYLGGAMSDRNRNVLKLTNPIENHDSSDSDLVSPPPIPTSPPPLDDLDTSLETEKSLEMRPRNISKGKMGDKELNKKLWSTSANNQDLENVEAVRNKKRRPVSEDILERLEESEGSAYEKPLVFSELDSIGSRNGLVLGEECGDINLDEYLELSSTVNAQLYSKNFSENIYKSCQKEIHKNLMPKESLNKATSSEKSLLKMQYSDDSPKASNNEGTAEKGKSINEVQYENLQSLFTSSHHELSDTSNDYERQAGLALYRNVAFPEVPPPENYRDYESTEKSKVCFDPDTLQQKSNNDSLPVKGCLENQGAPYYYSDIIKNDEEDFGSSQSERSTAGLRGLRYQPLNNQRDNLQEGSQCSKRNDIGRKVNQISQNHLAFSGTSQGSNLDDVEKITAELRTTSARFMGAADKSGTVDVRNIYESDTLQRRKGAVMNDEISSRKTDMHHPLNVARNLYPHGIKDKTTGATFKSTHTPEFSGVQNHRSRSLEGLLNDVDYLSDNRNRERIIDQTSNRFPNQANSSSANKEQGNHSRVDSYEGDDLWDKDTLWRENLRKVSLRHTRSLDNLDDDAGSSANRRLTVADKNLNSGRRSVDHFTDPRLRVCPSGRRSVDHFSTPGKAKLTRDVTYVNDSVRRNAEANLAREYEQDYSENWMRSKKRESEIQTVVELNDSGVLDCDDGIHYEKLTRYRPAVQKTTRKGKFAEGCDWDGFRRNQPEGNENSPKAKEPSFFLGTQSSSQNVKETLALEPIDREKLRQWDLMSSGTVEQEIEQKKMDQQQDLGKELGLKKLGEAEAESEAGLAEYLPEGVQTNSENQLQQGSAQTMEASGSGSVMREPHLPHPPSASPQLGHQIRQIQSPLQSVSSLPVTPNENLKNSNAGREPDRVLIDYNQRIDYYDRGKSNNVSLISPMNGFPESREDMKKGEDLINSYSDRGRAINENSYYVDQYQERKAVPQYPRNFGTLPLAKGITSPLSNTVTLPGSSSLGRNANTMDGRYYGKENLIKRKESSSPWGLDVSAGELLGRTHEELVLLLIQLRRQSASVCKAMESCHIEIEEQARLSELDTPKRLEHIRKLEKLKKHLLELEKQYEKGKPLVNLVDNMVKLGSLYRGNNSAYNGSAGVDHNTNVREKLEFNQKVQEQRLLAEERRDWNRLSPDHGQLQAKVQQLYRLDRLLQEESGTLHSLQQDKELLEKALGGLRHKLQVNRRNPVEADRYRKQQKLLEKELSRVRLLLAHNSKKLEETVAENARLEQELVILRQKLQASRISGRSSVPLLPETATISTTAALEAELRRVQQLVGDLQRQRHELSAQVKQLTEKSDTLVQQIRPGPTGVAGAGPIPGKKKFSATWLETDLDLLITQDVGVESPISSPQQQQPLVVTNSRGTTPIYINTETSKKDMSISLEEAKSPVIPSYPTSGDEIQTKSYCTPVELSEADERMKRFYGIIPKEKQEIKTVRIVKRESERRQRDRDRSGSMGIPIGNMAVAKRISVIEENDSYGLGRVEEESYENNFQNSSTFPEIGDEYQEQKPLDFRVNNEGDDPYMHFHPTNPFLPQNLNGKQEEMKFIERDVTASPSQKSMSLPRGFGKNNASVQPIKNESAAAMKNLMSKRNRVRFESPYQEGGSGSESGPNSPRNESPSRNYNSCIPNQEYACGNGRGYEKSYGLAQKPYGFGDDYEIKLRTETEQKNEVLKKEKNSELGKSYSARKQLFGSNYYTNEDTSPQLSPVYQSEAAREIIMEMSNNPLKKNGNRRQIRKEKRRHHTVSNIRHVTDNQLSKLSSTRSRDDLDMERALRPRINAPDVVRSTMNHMDLKYNESTIDNILGTPNKIVIPERYIPEQEPLLSAEEQLQRLKKAESIKKMLSETTALSTPDLSGDGLEEEKKSFTLRKKVEEEKKQREHLLELNQILAQQVMEKSKLVAVQAMSALASEERESSFDDSDLSPVQPLPIYQQRENFFS